MKKINVVVTKAMGEHEAIEMPNTLEAMQEMVGGYIEVVKVDGLANLYAVVDEEGLLKGKPLTYAHGGLNLVGTIVWCSIDADGEFCGITGLHE